MIVFGAVGAGSGCLKATTTENPPFREDKTIRVELRGDDGRLRKVGLGRVKYLSKP